MASKKTSLTEFEMKECKQILKKLLSREHKDIAWVFYDPVDPVLLDLDDYNEIVRYPMDLSTVQTKLSEGAYATHEDFAFDVRLIFHNTYLYTEPNHLCHDMARKLQNIFEALYTKFVEKLAAKANDPDALTSSEASEENVGEKIMERLSWLPANEINRRISSQEQLSLDSTTDNLDPKFLPNLIKLINHLEGENAKFTITEDKISTRKLKTTTRRYIMAYICLEKALEENT